MSETYAWVVTSIGNETGERDVRSVHANLADLIAYYERSWYIPGGSWAVIDGSASLGEAFDIAVGGEDSANIRTHLGRDVKAEKCEVENRANPDHVRQVREALSI